MAYDELLADRVREALGPDARVIEIRMFGGLCFMVGNHMTCGIIGNDLMARVGPEAYDRAIGRPHAGPMNFTGRPMVGIIRVAAEGCRTGRAVKTWVDGSVAFTATLPPKKRKPPRKRKPPKKRPLR